MVSHNGTALMWQTSNHVLGFLHIMDCRPDLPMINLFDPLILPASNSMYNSIIDVMFMVQSGYSIELGEGDGLQHIRGPTSPSSPDE